MSLKRSSHAVYDTAYHLVWCPKYRKKIFAEDEIRERAEQLIKEICEEYGIEVDEMEVAIDHVHMLVVVSTQAFDRRGDQDDKKHKCERTVPRVPADQEAASGGRASGRWPLRPYSRGPYDSANH